MNSIKRVRLLGAALLLVAVLLAFAGYTAINSSRIKQQNSNYAMDAAIEKARYVENDMNQALNNVKSYAYFFTRDMNSGMIDIAALKTAEAASAFDGIRYTDITGLNYASDGSMSDATDRDYYQKGIKGEAGVTVIFDSRINSKTMIGFYAPVYYKDYVCGVLRGVYNADEYLRSMLENEFFGEAAFSYLCNNEGEIIAFSSDDINYDAVTGRNISDYLIDKLSGNEQLREDIHAAVSDSNDSVLNVNDCAITDNIAVVKLMHGEFILIQIFPKAVDQQMIKEANSAGGMLLAILLVLFSLYIVLIIICYSREKLMLREENRERDYVAAGVKRLVDEFILVDIEERVYRYLNGSKPSVEGVEVKGSYNKLLEAIVSHLRDKAEEQQIRELFALANISRQLARSEDDSLLLPVHLTFGENEKWLNIYVIIIEKNGGEASKVLMSIQDVTQSKQIDAKNQEKLRIAYEEAGRVNRVKNVLMNFVSRDIKSYVNTIVGMSSAVMRERNQDRIYKYSGDIEQAGKGISGIVSDIQDLMNIEKDALEIIRVQYSVTELIQTCTNIMGRSFEEKGIELLLDIDENIPAVLQGDEVRIRQIIQNMLMNVMRNTDSRAVTLKLTCCEAVRGIPVSGEDDTYLAISIIDEEYYVNDKNKSVLQLPAAQLIEAEESQISEIGIGFIVVKYLIEKMHGRFMIESDSRKGSVFTIAIPQHIINALPIGHYMKSEVRESSKSDFKAPFKAQNVRVLAVDDVPENFKVFKLLLSETGVHVDVVKGRVAAANVCKRQKYDLIYLDHQMIDDDGRQLLNSLKSDENNINYATPVLVFASGADREDMEKYQQFGVVEYLSKPVDVQQIYDTFLKHVDSEKVIRDGFFGKKLQ